MPCKLCKERGFRCGVDDKVPGPKTRLKSSDEGAKVILGRHAFAIPRSLPSASTDETMTSVDMKYWQHISEFHLMLLLREITGHVFGNPVPLTLTVPFPEFPLSSKPFRYAALALASSHKEGNADTLMYLAKFYKYMKEAIDASSIVEVAVASYMIVLYAYKGHECFSTVLVHFKGMCHAFIRLKQSKYRMGIREVPHMQTLWHGALQTLYLVFWGRPHHTSPLQSEEFKLLGELDNVLQFSSAMLSSVDNSQIHSSWRTCEALGCYLAFYLDHYLALRNRRAANKDIRRIPSITASLHNILRQIIHLVPQIPEAREMLYQASDASSYWNCENDPVQSGSLAYHSTLNGPDYDFRDKQAAMLFAFAKLIESVFVIDVNKTLAITSAVFLCRICAMLFYQQSEVCCSRTRALFWSGLVLTKSSHPVGKKQAT